MVLSPEEFQLWNAFYCIEPFGDSLRYSAEIEAGVKGFRQPILPSECKLNQPLEDIDLEAQNKRIAEQMTEYVKGLLQSEGRDLDKEIQEAAKKRI